MNFLVCCVWCLSVQFHFISRRFFSFSILYAYAKSDFERDMVVGARQAALSISETADLLGCYRTNISSVYREPSEKVKTSSEQQFAG